MPLFNRKLHKVVDIGTEMKIWFPAPKELLSLKKSQGRHQQLSTGKDIMLKWIIGTVVPLLLNISGSLLVKND